MKTKQAGRLRLAEIILLLFLAAFLASGAMALQTGQELSDKVVRLHVLANSDSQEDQALKLKVRDRILAYTEPLLAGAADRREAEALLRGQVLELERVAAQEIRANGCDYAVTIELEDTVFPTREYEGFTLPAGKYLALRTIIGEGAGQNWWCVVFPPLCAAASAEVPETALAAGLSSAQVGLITEEDQGYVLKSKLVEFWRGLEAKLD
ncbi:MAG: stage II sporulation protein R [Oscillibacter sp.]|nr:stage II sporulation protein R [Oscillibacter sp.]